MLCHLCQGAGAAPTGSAAARKKTVANSEKRFIENRLRLKASSFREMKEEKRNSRAAHSVVEPDGTGLPYRCIIPQVPWVDAGCQGTDQGWRIKNHTETVG
jgi:hypothetical protein